LETVVYQSLVEEDAPLAQEITTVADNLHTPVRVIAVNPCQDFVVRQAVPLLDRHTLGGPCPLDGIVVLVITDWDGVVYDVTDGLDFSLKSNFFLGCTFRQTLLLLLEIGLLLQEIRDVFLSLATG
jgi:hypothetical protein